MEVVGNNYLGVFGYVERCEIGKWKQKFLYRNDWL